jgi:hypothetical protein
MLTVNRHFSISWTRPIQSTLILFLRYISIFTKHLQLCLPNIPFPLVFHQRNLTQTSFSPSCVLHSLSILWFSLCSCLQPSITSSFLTPNVFIGILFLNSPILCSSLILKADFHTHIKREDIYIYINSSSYFFNKIWETIALLVSHAYCPVETTTATSLNHTSRVWGTNVHTNPSSVCGDAAEKVFCSLSKVHLISDWSPPNVWIASRILRRTSFQKNPCNGRQNTDEKCSLQEGNFP